jgi:hypothetical protein
VAQIFLWPQLYPSLVFESRVRRKGKENDRAPIISYNIRCEGRGYKDVH